MNAHTQVSANDIANDELAAMHEANRRQFELLVRQTVELAKIGGDVSEDVDVIIKSYNDATRSNERMLNLIRNGKAA